MGFTDKYMHYYVELFEIENRSKTFNFSALYKYSGFMCGTMV